jgi:hypothetical protein
VSEIAQSGLTAGKRLQVKETMRIYVNNVALDAPRTLNLDGTYTYDNEGKLTSVNYPTTYVWNNQTSSMVPTTGPTWGKSHERSGSPGVARAGGSHPGPATCRQRVRSSGRWQIRCGSDPHRPAR